MTLRQRVSATSVLSSLSCLLVAAAFAEAPHGTEQGGAPSLRAANGAAIGAALESPRVDPSLGARGEATQQAADAELATKAMFASFARELPKPVDDVLPAPLPRSTLPVPLAPPPPVPRRIFEIAPADPALAAAQDIARRVSQMHNFRAQIPGAVWRDDPGALFAIRSQSTCFAELHRRGIAFRKVDRELSTPVPAPVAIVAPIGGVAFASLHPDREVEVSCELAVRLPLLADILRAHGVLAVGVNSSYRPQPKASFHTFGLALDIAAFRTRARTLFVAKHFEPTPDELTCDHRPATPEGKTLLDIACALADSHAFSSVLTPNYNEGHRDHFHVDVRPDDSRLFLR